jgi:hypothetical protein
MIDIIILNFLRLYIYNIMSFDINRKGPVPKRVSAPPSRDEINRSSPKEIMSPKRISDPPSRNDFGVRSKVYDEEDKTKKFRNMIQGFVIVPKNLWVLLPLNAFIRYEKNDGSLVLGGYIYKKFLTNMENSVDSFELSTKKDGKGDHYIGYFAEIKQIYKRPPEDYQIEHQLMIENIRNLSSKINGVNDYDQKIMLLSNKIDAIISKLSNR